jgi:hypothetical protein
VTLVNHSVPASSSIARAYHFRRIFIFIPLVAHIISIFIQFKNSRHAIRTLHQTNVLGRQIHTSNNFDEGAFDVPFIIFSICMLGSGVPVPPPKEVTKHTGSRIENDISSRRCVQCRLRSCVSVVHTVVLIDIKVGVIYEQLKSLYRTSQTKALSLPRQFKYAFPWECGKNVSLFVRTRIWRSYL